MVLDSSLVTALLGSGGAAGVALVLILLGILVPKPYHQRILDELEDKQRVIEKISKANDVLSEANAQLRDANNNLTSSGQLTNTVVTALLEIAAQNRGAPVPAPPAQAPPSLPPGGP